MENKNEEIKKRLEYLRGEIQAECISYGEIAELQSLAQYIDAGDVVLLEAAGVPEFEEEQDQYAGGKKELERMARKWIDEHGAATYGAESDSDSEAYTIINRFINLYCL